MKFLVFFTQEYDLMRRRCLASLKDDYEIIQVLVDYKRILESGGGINTWVVKTDLIVDAIEGNIGADIIFSDIDIHFYKKTKSIVAAALEGKDMVFQREHPCGGVNIGFFAMRCNDVTLGFWKTVRERLRKTMVWDQVLVNTLLYSERYRIRWGRFSSEMFSCSQWGMHDVLSYADLLERVRHCCHAGFRMPVPTELPGECFVNSNYVLSSADILNLWDRKACLYHANFAGHEATAMQKKLEHLDYIDDFMHHRSKGDFIALLRLGVLLRLTSVWPRRNVADGDAIL